jgi:NADH:ubiquinone reductase (non-electrogenic)
MVVIGGGPSGIEVAGELRDFLEVSHLLLDIIVLAHLEQKDLKNWYPELHPYMRLTPVETLPSVPDYG